jgi:hypothetical protein
MRVEALGAAIERPHLLESEVLDVVPHVRELGISCEGWARVRALRGRHLPVVGDDGFAILGYLDVELEGGDAEFEGVGERLEGALGYEPETAAMGFEIEEWSGGGKRALGFGSSGTRIDAGCGENQRGEDAEGNQEPPPPLRGIVGRALRKSTHR